MTPNAVLTKAIQYIDYTGQAITVPADTCVYVDSDDFVAEWDNGAFEVGPGDFRWAKVSRVG